MDLRKIEQSFITKFSSQNRYGMMFKLQYSGLYRTSHYSFSLKLIEM